MAYATTGPRDARSNELAGVGSIGKINNCYESTTSMNIPHCLCSQRLKKEESWNSNTSEFCKEYFSVF